MQNTEFILKQMGQLLKSERLRRNESQAIFADRLGVHRNTIAKMEKADPGVRIEVWIRLFVLAGLEVEILKLIQNTVPLSRKRARKPKSNE